MKEEKTNAEKIEEALTILKDQGEVLNILKDHITDVAEMIDYIWGAHGAAEDVLNGLKEKEFDSTQPLDKEIN